MACLSLPLSHPNYADYVFFWLHHVNGSIQPAINSVRLSNSDDAIPHIVSTLSTLKFITLCSRLSEGPRGTASLIWKSNSTHKDFRLRAEVSTYGSTCQAIS